MSPLAIAALVAMTGYAIYKQSQRHEVTGRDRFKMAIVYTVVGLLVGGFSQPHGGREWALLLVGLLLSVVVGVARGYWTRMWTEEGQDGRRRVWSQGTALTIGLFVGLVVAKFAMGTYAYFAGISDDGGFGEILVMIAVMVAFQAELVWRRALAMGVSTVPETVPETDAEPSVGR